MANFRVAHLSRLAARHPLPLALSLATRDNRDRAGRETAWREQRGIAVLFPLLSAAGIDAPAVANDEHHRASHISRTVPMNENDGQAVLCFHRNFRTFAAVKDRRYKRKMKWRNQLLALVCLLVFAGVGVIYFQHWVIRKPFGIILFVGEGLSPATAGADSHLRSRRRHTLEHGFDAVCALLMNYSKDFAAPDQAAAATAIATGERVNNRADRDQMATANPLRALSSWPANTDEPLAW